MNNKEAFETVASRKYPWLTFAKANDGSYLSTHIIDLYKGFCLASQAQQDQAKTFEEFTKTLDPLWNASISRTYAERFFYAGLSAMPANHIPEVGKMVKPELAKHQPCGCVICTCEHETQCQGCGAKNCGTHAVGDIPNPAYLQSQLSSNPLQFPPEWIKNVSRMWQCVRKHDCSIPDRDLDLMREILLKAQQPAQESVKRNAILLNSIAEAARCLGVAQAKEDKDAIEHFNKVVDDLVLSQQPAQEPVAYRVIASVNGEVVRDSLEFTRMSEIDEKVVRKSYDLKIIPLFASQAQQDHIGDSNKLAQPIIDTDSAREFLIANVISKFSDSTFQSYVRNELAGDFAYQLARYFQAQYPSWLLKSTQDLAVHMWQKHYKAESPVFEVLNDLAGVISQIDNMTTGLVREQPQVQQEPEPQRPDSKDQIIAELIDILVCATHHEGALQECKAHWLPVVRAELEFRINKKPYVVSDVVKPVKVHEVPPAQDPVKTQFLDRSKEKIIELMWQGVCDGTVEAFDVNGMMTIPSEAGVTYVRREDAISFFGLVEPVKQEGEIQVLSKELIDCFRAADYDGFMVILHENERLVEIWNRRIAPAFSDLEEYISEQSLPQAPAPEGGNK